MPATRVRPVIKLRRKKPVIKLRLKKQPISRAVNALARRQRNISRNLYQWKSYRIMNTDQSLDMNGDLTSSAPNNVRAFAWELSDIPFHDPHTGVGNELAVSMSRMTTRPFVDRVNANISVKCTHNQSTTIRFIALHNDGWMEALNLDYTGVTAPQIANCTNLFKDWLTLQDKTLASTSADSQQISLAVINKALSKRGKGVLLDKTYSFRPYQNETNYQSQAMVSGTGNAAVDQGRGSQAGTNIVRTFKFNIPIKKRIYYERRRDVDGEVYDIKNGKIFFLILAGSASNNNSENYGYVTVDARFATVFKENT